MEKSMKWDYKIIKLGQSAENNQSLLRKYGNSGWELMGVDNGMAYFKKKIVFAISDDEWTEQKMVGHGLGEHGLW